jgi:hypothetical protein
MQLKKMPCPIGLSAAMLLCLSAVSCQQPGYRTEVYPGQQGQVAVRQVPVAVPAHTETVPSALPVSQQDADLREVESLWPRLGPDDRKRVADMARRLAPADK